MSVQAAWFRLGARHLRRRCRPCGCAGKAQEDAARLPAPAHHGGGWFGMALPTKPPPAALLDRGGSSAAGRAAGRREAKPLRAGRLG